MSNIVECRDREEWLAERAKGITATDIGVILGLSKWKSPYTLWAERTGQLEPDEENLPMKVGRALEPVVAEAYEAQTDRRLQDLGDFTIVKHPKYDLLRCTPDRLHVDDGSPCELKTTQWHGQEGQSLSWQLQLQVQMHCLGADDGVIAALIKANKLDIEYMQRNERFVDAVMPEVDAFWECIQKEIPPEYDDSESTQETIKRMYPEGDPDKYIEIVDDRVVSAIIELQLCKEEIKRLEADKRASEILIQAAMQDAAKARIGQYVVSWPTVHRKGSLSLEEKFIESLQEYNIPFRHTESSSYRRMTIKESK